jgi:short-subunit dehydrogenase
MSTQQVPLAVITGASEGLGKEYAKQLAAEGYNLLIIARRANLLDELKTELEAKYNVRVEPLVCDLTNPGELKQVEDRLEKEEMLEMLVNNAGFVFGNVYPDVDPDLEESMIRLHVIAVMRLSRAALAPMCKRKKGYVINVSSVAAFFFGRDSVEYTATKGYALSFSKSLQYDVHRYGVKVQALCPGFTHTGIHSTELMKFFKKESVPNWLWLTPERVVRTSLKSIRRRSSIFGTRVVCIPSFRYKMIVALFGNSIGGATLDFFSKLVGAPTKPGLER